MIMNFSNLNFGQLVQILDNEELKNRIRNFEKQRKQTISAQYGKHSPLNNLIVVVMFHT